MIPSTNTQLLVGEDWKKIYQSFRNADFKSYDFETLRRTMISYLQENYPEDFNDFIDSSEYIALIDLIAYLGQNLSFRIDLNARENFLETAQRRDSILRLAQLISYRPKRNTPANGFLKVTAISTTDSVIDSNGNNLANTTIGWNDSTNSNWYQQFVNIMNSAMSSNFGNPADRETLDGILTEQYYLNGANADVPLFSFNKNIDGVSMGFEVAPCTFVDKTYVYESAPKPANQFSFIYKNDNQGSGSADTGFFTMFKQGSLSMVQFSLDNPVPNEIVGINTPDINDTDVWLWQLDKNGNFSTLWTDVPTINNSNNVIYNSLNKNLRTIYAIAPRENDQIDLNFADGVFGDLPKGDFRLFYRQSNGKSYVIKPEQMSGIVIQVPYVNGVGQTHTLQMTLSLQYTVSNSSGAESNASIQTKAPQNYYLQNRMITGEDYNIAPLSAGSDILKIKSVNRVSSGLSKYFDISDVTGGYSKTNIFATDGILYQEEAEEYFEFDFTSRNQVLSVIKNSLAPIVSSTGVRSFYINKYDNFDLTLIPLTWNEVNKTPGQSRGYFYDATVPLVKVPVSIGEYSENNLKYVTQGALVKFSPPIGQYFDADNNLVAVTTTGATAGLIPSGGRDYMWSMVYQVIGDGNNSGAGALDDGTGPVIFSSRVPQGAKPIEVIPKYVHTLNFSIENEIANLCMSQRNFGLTISADSRSWDIILNSNLNLLDSFSLDTQGNVEDAGLDSSWIIAFVWTGKNYKVRYRNLYFIFESKAETAFYVDNDSVNYDFTTNSVVKDRIDVLAVNSLPPSARQWRSGAGAPATNIGNNGDYYLDTTKNTNNIYRKITGSWFTGNNFTGKLSSDYSWQIDGPVVESDGYVEPKKVKVSFYDYNNTGQLQDPESFATIVAPNYVDRIANIIDHKINFVYFKKLNDGLRYELTTGIIPFETEADFYTYKNALPNSVAVNDLFYFYSPSVNVVKYWSGTTLVYTDQYFARPGRSDLNFHYVHNSGNDRRIDPSKSNIIDIYVLTTGYDNSVRSWLAGNTASEPLPPTSYGLEQNYSASLEPIKAISDEIIFHSVKYKVLFGSNATTSLQAKFKAVRNSERPTTDNDLKTRILTAINEFFALENWDFGQSFYFSELSTYVMNQLTPDITNFVVTPKSVGSFGSLYEVACQSNEIFINGAGISDIEIIDAVTASQLKSTSAIVTTSGT
jgi:hypothetical protein